MLQYHRFSALLRAVVSPAKRVERAQQRVHLRRHAVEVVGVNLNFFPLSSNRWRENFLGCCELAAAECWGKGRGSAAAG
jgi:hypothetical protein